MKVLLVEPDYRRASTSKKKRVAELRASDKPVVPSRLYDETLWYPPLALMKLSRFHKDRGDFVQFVSGCDRSASATGELFDSATPWDRVYITTLFTYHFDRIAETIRFYKNAVGGKADKVFVGGIMASLMPGAIYEETGVRPITGVLQSPRDIGLDGDDNIDLLTPDYEMLDAMLYAVNQTYYGYTSRGCVNACGWCGVPRIEPAFVPYIDIKPMIRALRGKYGDKPILKLMDNNVLASPELPKIVDDLVELGYGRGERTNALRPSRRVVDFNQGLDASYCTEERIALLSKLNVNPMRIAFDRVNERTMYVHAVELAHRYGFRRFSNYMLYNFRDTPQDMYERLMVNIRLNKAWIRPGKRQRKGEIYSFPMRYAPIAECAGDKANRQRDLVQASNPEDRDWLREPVWTRRSIRNMELMKAAVHGAISPTPGLALRTIGRTFQEFVANLYMPEELLRYRNKHERHVHKGEPARAPGTGNVEAFRRFIIRLLRKRDTAFNVFHGAVSQNTVAAIREALLSCKTRQLREWLTWYLKK